MSKLEKITLFCQICKITPIIRIHTFEEMTPEIEIIRCKTCDCIPEVTKIIHIENCPFCKIEPNINDKDFFISHNCDFIIENNYKTTLHIDKWNKLVKEYKKMRKEMWDILKKDGPF